MLKYLFDINFLIIKVTFIIKNKNLENADNIEKKNSKFLLYPYHH